MYTITIKEKGMNKKIYTSIQYTNNEFEAVVAYHQDKVNAFESIEYVHIRRTSDDKTQKITRKQV